RRVPLAASADHDAALGVAEELVVGHHALVAVELAPRLQGDQIVAPLRVDQHHPLAGRQRSGQRCRRFGGATGASGALYARCRLTSAIGPSSTMSSMPRMMQYAAVSRSVNRTSGFTLRAGCATGPSPGGL